MPNILVSDATFAELQSRAVALVDTPDTVIQRLLRSVVETNGDSSSVFSTSMNGERVDRAPYGEGLSRSIYHETLLVVIADAGGRVSRQQALAEVGRRLQDLFTPIDLSMTSTGRLRWRVRTGWARKHLVQEGLLRADSERGVWELTDDGRERARELRDS